jgi:Cna protein B-type domain./TonB-dependent Receptor Plug Domain.
MAKNWGVCYHPPMSQWVFRTVFVCLLFANVLRGQGTTSRAIGIIQDPSGAAVAGASVRLTNEGTNASFTTTSAENGAYFFEAVQPGRYTVSVEAPGFKKFASRGNIVSIGQPTTVNVTLEVGGVSEQIEVVESAEVVQTSTSGNIGNLFSDRVIADLPIVGTRGRNPLDLVTRQPGVVSGANTGGGVHVNGARDRAWNYTLDGIDVNETSAGGSNFAPLRANPDSLAEFRVLTSNATAEFGRNSGGQVAMVTKSGTNEIHGNLFWFYRTPRLNANEWEFNLNDTEKRQFVQNILGGSVGGPIIKNRTFYYGNLQVLRARESAIVNRTVYTETARQGIWRYVIGGRNQPAGVPNASVDANGNVLPGVNIGTYNIIASDPERIGADPRIRDLIASTPLPNNFTLGDGLNTAGYTFAALQNEKQYDSVIKLDHILNDKNTVYARVAWGRQDTDCDRGNGGSPFFPGGDCVVNTKRDPRNLAFNWRTNPRPNLTNEFVVGQNYFAFDFVTPTSDLSKVTLTGAPVTVPETFDFGNRRALTTWQFVDNLAWFRGAHSLKFGINFRLQRHEDVRGSIGGYNATQGVNFSRLINTVDPQRFGLPANMNSIDRENLESSINFILGRVGSTFRGFPAQDGRFVAGLYNFDARFNEYDFYVQDTWKVRRNLTVDLGLRWEAKMAPRAGSGSVIRRPDAALVYGAPNSNSLRWVDGSLYRDDWNNLSPAVGFAWDPFSSGKTSIRANYRIAYDRINTFVLSSSVFQNLPGAVDSIETQAYGQAGGRLANLPVLDPPTRTPEDLAQPAAFGLRNIAVVDPNFKTPTTHQWSFGIQREVARNTVLEIDYIGRRAYNLFGAYNANQVNITGNGFLDAVKTVQAGGQSPLINQLLGPDPRRSANETGSDLMRRVYAADLRNNAVASIANDLSRRSVGSTSLVEAAGLSRFFFMPYPQFISGATVIDSNDFSTYHALQVQVEKRFSSGFTYQLSYTLSKSLDTRSFDPAFTTAATGSSQSASSTPFDIGNRRLNYALSDFDRTHVVQSYWLLELPFGRGRRFASSAGPMLERLIGGWQVAGFLTISSGRPFTIFSGYNTFSNVVQSTANCSGCKRGDGGVYQGAGGFAWYLTPEEIAKFQPVGPGELGNTGRNFFRGPGSFVMNASFMKRTALTERFNLELRADITNLTNTPTFGFPTAVVTSTTFGRIRDTIDSESRKIQLGAKINF